MTTLKKLVRQKDGVAAVEFAILAPMFFLSMMAIFEITYFLFMSSNVQRGLEEAVHDVRTGHAYEVINQYNYTPEQWYKKKICETVIIPSCESKIALNIKYFNSDMNQFSDSAVNGNITAGVAGILMRVEAIVSLPSIMFNGFIFGEDAFPMRAGLTFMTEPYS